jgi:alkylation response protein AidB-like acyl-CoA dehydrogenase
MDFDTSEEQDLLQDTVQQFIDGECPITKVREIFDGDSGHDPALWQQMVELGLGGIAIPEEYGGAGLEVLDLALVAETLGGGAVPGPFFSHSLACLAVLLAGSDEQKKSWLPRLVAGEALGTIAFGESGGVWQPDQWTLASNGGLSGTKSHVPYASISDLIVVGAAGGALAIVESGTSDVEIKPLDTTDRSRPVDEVTFSGARCELLPEGVKASGRVRDAACVLLAADAFGGASRLVRMSVDYANTREQFGVTIGHFQALKHQLAGFTWECDVQIYFKRALFDRTFLGAPADHRERAAVLAGW